jgi:hypothetical protein
MKNNIQEQVYAETHNMSKEELLSYFNKNYAKVSIAGSSPKRRRGVIDTR